ncbi:MAG TPA: acyl-CoA synthetase FdrA [Anaerolineales bacterium]
MAIKTLIKPSEYHDSVRLMVVARDLARLPQVEDAAVVMGTEANKALLKAAGLLDPAAEAATPNDLVIAVSAAPEALDEALAEAERLLHAKAAEQAAGKFRPKTLRSAVKAQPAANVAVISVAGRYAVAEAWQALRMGLHVLLFSDNVSIEDEIALKQHASQHGLLLMGPGAGTALLNGAALGFANRIPSGPVGIISAAGTGLQEVSTLLARHGVGITQGIGTGGRDLKEAVGGIMMLDGLKALQADPATQVIVLISKPPAPEVARKVLEQVGRSAKPTVLCLLGAAGGGRPPSAGEGIVFFAHTLQEAALLAARRAGADLPPLFELLAEEQARLSRKAAFLREPQALCQRYLRGLFSGGTLCYEAQVIWRDLLPEPVFSNAPLDIAWALPDPTISQGHTAVDLGEEEFTVGRPHPMLDNDLRIRRLLQEAHDPETAVVMLDLVLGYGAHPDPASELGPAVIQARQVARGAGRELLVIGSVTGTEQDPQRLSRQVQALESAGVLVCESNASAARLAAGIVCG